MIGYIAALDTFSSQVLAYHIAQVLLAVCHTCRYVIHVAYSWDKASYLSIYKFVEGMIGEYKQWQLGQTVVFVDLQICRDDCITRGRSRAMPIRLVGAGVDVDVEWVRLRRPRPSRSYVFIVPGLYIATSDCL
jgi:hypothetical protein